MGERFASWFAVAMLFVVLAASYWYAQSLRQNDADSGRIGQVDFFAENIALTGFDALGRGHFRLFADRMMHFTDSDDVDLTNPRLLSLRTDQPLVQTTARNARAYNNGQTVRLTGDVVVTRAAEGTRPAMRLETEELYTAPDDDRYWTDQPVLMRRGDAVMHGTGMDFDNVARRLELRSEVTGAFPPRSQP
jgi:LPS export ABC transporter protein LptC